MGIWTVRALRAVIVVVVGGLLVEHEEVHGGVVADLGELGDLLRAAGESGASEEMLDAVVSSCHASGPGKSKSRSQAAQTPRSTQNPARSRDPGPMHEGPASLQSREPGHRNVSQTTNERLRLSACRATTGWR